MRTPAEPSPRGPDSTDLSRMEAVNEYGHGHDHAGSGPFESGVTGRLDRDPAAYCRGSAVGRGSIWPCSVSLWGLSPFGASSLDLGPQEARLGLASGEQFGPMGQALGYWAPDLWPAQVIPSIVLTRLTASGRPSTALFAGPPLSHRSSRAGS